MDELAQETEHQASRSRSAAEALAREQKILDPRAPRPRIADQVLGMLLEEDLRPAETQATEIQTALRLAAAEAGICIVPSSGRKLRPDAPYSLQARS